MPPPLSDLPADVINHIPDRPDRLQILFAHLDVQPRLRHPRHIQGVNAVQCKIRKEIRLRYNLLRGNFKLFRKKRP